MVKMRLSFGIWFGSFLIGVWTVNTLGALPNGAHDLDSFVIQEQQAQGGKSSSHGNRVFNRAVRGPQGNVPTPRSNGPIKSQSGLQKNVYTPPVQEAEKEPEVASPNKQSEENEDTANEKEENSSPVSSTTSTEPSRKSVGGVIRPFRSNKDLLDSLKRRRQMQQQHGYTVVPPTSPSTSTTERTQAAKNTHQTNRKLGNLNVSKPPVPSADQTGLGSQKKTTANSNNSRRYNAKVTPGSTTTQHSVYEAVAAESNVATQSARSRTYPKVRRTS